MTFAPVKNAIHSLLSWRNALYAPWIILFAWMVDLSWFLTDDAFVTFRYVRNLVEGHGLVFNVGERVEGYTNFLWALELAAFRSVFGIRPEHASPWLSVAYTAGTFVVLFLCAARLPAVPKRGLVQWMAVGLVCSSATFAVWTSGGGLETRQFTFFTVLAVTLLVLGWANEKALAAASLSLAAAALTRPEGTLVAAVCIGWFAVQSAASRGRISVDFRKAAWLGAPFAAAVAAHFLWRYAYYGEWLPNTYYAKHVGPWYEMGFRYLYAAAVETGAWMWLPLACVSAVIEWRARRTLTCVLPVLLTVIHAAYVARIGGDHFEYRPLDFYWPLLALPTALGIVLVGEHAVGRRGRLRRGASGACALVLYIPVVFYSGAIQAGLLFEGARTDGRVFEAQIDRNWQEARWLVSAPGISTLADISDRLRRDMAPHLVGLRFAEHREFAKRRLEQWGPYENIERGILPHDTTMAVGSIGIQPYFLPDVTVVDTLGLTDAVVARTPVNKPNGERQIGHDRRAPPGYLESRGVNFTAHPAAFDEVQALCSAQYAIVSNGIWLPFDTRDRPWVEKRFDPTNLRYSRRSNALASDNRFCIDGQFYVGEAFVEQFERNLDSWRWDSAGGEPPRDGAPLGPQRLVTGRGQGLAAGHVGAYFNSFHAESGDFGTGSGRTSGFVGRADRYLVLLVAGGAGAGVGVRLLADGKTISVWRGRNNENFRPVAYPLRGLEGKTLWLEVFDDDTEPWGHIVVDHVLLARHEPVQ